MDWRRAGRTFLLGPLLGARTGWRGCLIAAVVAWLPAGLVLAGAVLAALTGCTASEAGAKPCPVAGLDIGRLLYTLTVLVWLVIPLLPVMVFTLALALVTGALALIQALWRRSHAR